MARHRPPLAAWAVARALLAALLALLAPHPGWASSQDLYGFGSRGIAMGGAVVSNVEGYAAVYYNPAALVESDRYQFAVGYQRADNALALNGDDYPIDPASNLLIGLDLPLPLGGFLEGRLALGLGFVMPTDSILTANIARPEEPSFIIVDNRAHVVGIHVALGVRIFDWLSVGGGAVALAALDGGIDVAPNDIGNLGSVVRDEVVADYAPIFGLLVEPVDWLSFGATFHGISESRFTFPITADLGPDFPVELPLMNVGGLPQFDPLQVSVEISFRGVAGLLLATGVTYKQWSDFENPIINTTAAVPEQDPAGFVDIWVPRAAAEYVHPLGEVSLAGRLGWFYEKSPVLQQVANHNYLDSSRTGIGLGAGVSWRRVTVDLVGQIQLMRDRTHVKDTALVRDPENPGLPRISHGGHIVVSAIEVGVSL